MVIRRADRTRGPNVLGIETVYDSAYKGAVRGQWVVVIDDEEM